MNKRQQQLFISFFEELHETEQILDRLKVDLTACQGYNPNLLFDIISDEHDCISIRQMRSYITQRMACDERQLYEVFQKFDWSRQGSINRDDFLRQLTPFGKPPLQFRHKKGNVSSQIEGIFIALLLQILKRHRIVDVARKEIVFIQPYDAFQHLDRWKKGLIGLEQLERLYNQNDFEVSSRQLYYLLHALRRRCYRNINLEVFCENLNPLQFGEYANYRLQVEKNAQEDLLRRSRYEQEVIRRSRVQNQKLQHQLNRVQRRKQAEIQRELNLQSRIQKQLGDYEKSQEQYIKRAILEQERAIRSQAALNSSLYKQDQLRFFDQRRKEAELQQLKERQRKINENLRRSYLQKQHQLQFSQQKINNQRQKQLRQEIQREMQVRRRNNQLRNVQLSRQSPIRSSKKEERRDLASSHKKINESKYNYETASESIRKSRINELEKELQRTRLQMRERRSRLEEEERRSQLHSQVTPVRYL